MHLTPEEVSRYREDGFLLLRGFADPGRCAAILGAAEAAISTQHAPIETEGEYQGQKNPTLRRLRQVYDRHPLFREWMTEPAIRPALTQLLDDDPILTLAHHNSIMTKMPRTSTETCWHQDRRYWHFENDRLLSIWLALGDETMHNGVLEFIPGSHTHRFEPEQFDARTCFRGDLPRNAPLIDRRCHFDLHAGDVVLFHCSTLHHAFANTSDTPKIAFVYTVRAGANPPIAGTRSAAFAEITL